VKKLSACGLNKRSAIFISFLIGTLASTLFVTGDAFAAKKEKPVPVRWADPYVKLNVVPDDPIPEEEDGIELRHLPALGRTERWRKEVLTYSFVQNGVGLMDYAAHDQAISYEPGNQPGAFIKSTREFYTHTNPPGESIEVVEQDQLGEILQLIDAHMDMPNGQSRIVNYYRSNFFPESEAVPGDLWEYEGRFEMVVPNMSKEYAIERSPFEFKAVSTLAGFAEINGVRCAVIQTEKAQKQREIHRKGKEQITLDNESTVTEWEFWDYGAGALVARHTIGDYKTRNASDGKEVLKHSQTFVYRI